MLRRIVVLALALFLGLSPVPALGQSTVIRAGTLIDGTGSDPIRNVQVLIEGDRIVAIGRDIRVPGGAAVIDLSNYTVLPGFIDAHTHLAGRVLGEPGWQESYVRDTPADLALYGARNARLTINAGFTTVRNVGARGFSDVALRNAIDRGLIPGPRMLVSAHALGITGGHCDINGYVPDLYGEEAGIEDGVANGVEEIRSAIRYQVKYGANVIKFCATGGVLSEGDSVGVQQYTFEEMRAIVETAHMLERRVAAHAHGTAGIKVAIRAGVNSIEHGSILDDEAIELMLEHGTFLVPTLMAGEAVVRMVETGALSGERAEKAMYIAPLMHDSFGRAVRAGVRVALGTDVGVMEHGTNAHEFELMVEYGMTPMQAIVAGTSNGAELLGLESSIGTISVGKLADIVAVAGNPLEDIGVLRNVSFVMKAGQVVRGAGR